MKKPEEYWPKKKNPTSEMVQFAKQIMAKYLIRQLDQEIEENGEYKNIRTQVGTVRTQVKALCQKEHDLIWDFLKKQKQELDNRL